MRLIMIERFRAENTVEFTLRPEVESAEITWAMRGRTPYFAEIVHVFVDMENMVGRDFETGLASLKVMAEK